MECARITLTNGKSSQPRSSVTKTTQASMSICSKNKKRNILNLFRRMIKSVKIKLGLTLMRTILRSMFKHSWNTIIKNKSNNYKRKSRIQCFQEWKWMLRMKIRFLLKKLLMVVSMRSSIALANN